MNDQQTFGTTPEFAIPLLLAAAIAEKRIRRSTGKPQQVIPSQAKYRKVETPHMATKAARKGLTGKQIRKARKKAMKQRMNGGAK